MNKKIKIAGIKYGSMVDGPGIRISLFLSGCLHNCDGCHNKLFQDFEYGKEYTVPEIIKEIKKYVSLCDGLTISGGDPLFQTISLIELLQTIRNDPELKHMNIWLYTGFLFDHIPQSIKKYLTAIVDGKYDKTLPKTTWTGSNNQNVYLRVNNHFEKIKNNGEQIKC